MSFVPLAWLWLQNEKKVHDMSENVSHLALETPTFMSSDKYCCSVCQGSGWLLQDLVCPLCENDPNFFVDQLEDIEEQENKSENIEDLNVSSDESMTHTPPPASDASSSQTNPYNDFDTENLTHDLDQTVSHDLSSPSQMFPGLAKGFLLPPPRVPLKKKKTFKETS